MSDWNPSLYLHFAAERSRPAVELLARVPLENVEYVADLGCGPGNSTALLQQRWPAARITGIDSSPAMVAEAVLCRTASLWKQISAIGNRNRHSI